jgi:predicted alpha/beta superfamily hydrolase
VIFGQSLAGQFVLFTALTDPLLFWGHIASNPALHRNLEFFLRQDAVLEGEEHREPARVFVSVAELDEERFREPAVRWVEHWTGRQGVTWKLRVVTLEGHGHFSAAPEAFRQGVGWVLGEE